VGAYEHRPTDAAADGAVQAAASPAPSRNNPRRGRRLRSRWWTRRRRHDTNGYLSHLWKEIPRDTARVIGNNNQNVKACDRCRLAASGEEYSNVARAVRSFREGTGTWKQDYQHQVDQ